MNVSLDNDLNTDNNETTGKFLLSQRSGITCIDINDIGLAVANSNLIVKNKPEFILNKWKAMVDFQWPYSERLYYNKMRQRYLSPQHFTGSNNIFAYSNMMKGIFCTHCAIEMLS